MAGSVNAPTSFGRSRSSSGKRILYSLLGGITDRDMDLCLHLYEHHVLTTQQAFELLFPSYHRARKRLLLLYDRAVIGRFRPPQRPGSQPFHYVLDERGAKLVAGYLGVELKELKFRSDRVLRLSRSPFLRHFRETNGFFCRLAYACRQSREGTQLVRWFGERRAGKIGPIRPDGLGMLRRPGELVAFYLELDRGTEDGNRLDEKLIWYSRYDFDNAPHAILFCFHSGRRETSARRSLISCRRFTVATTTLERHMADPFGPNWLPLRAERRLSLFELPRPDRPELGQWEPSLVPQEEFL